MLIFLVRRSLFVQDTVKSSLWGITILNLNINLGVGGILLLCLRLYSLTFYTPTGFHHDKEPRINSLLTQHASGVLVTSTKLFKLTNEFFIARKLLIGKRQSIRHDCPVHNLSVQLARV